MIQRIGDYEVRFEIGRGGFGCVYQAFDPLLERLVALKVLNPAADAPLISRFRTEASAAGNLHHKNIVTVYGYGEDDGHHYIAMELLDGQTLQDLIQKSAPLTLLDRVGILSQIADGLLCAHRNGVVHRDVKPGNIMVLANGTVKIMDFGIARVLRDGSARLTQSGLLMGTIAYMAPEQFAADRDVDVLCDIWAYGVICYELLTGTNPFWAEDAGAWMYQITSRAPDPIRERCRECPPALEQVVQRLLSKDRDARYQSLEDVQIDVAPILLQLQRQHAVSLLGEASALLQQRHLDEAAALTRKILDLDPSNTEARQLRETVQEELRRRALRPRVNALMKEAGTEAERKNYASALKAVDSALHLIPDEITIRQYHESLQAAAGQVEEAARLLAQARAEFDAGNLAGASETVTAALTNDPDNTAARQLLERVQKLRRDLSRVEVMLDLGGFIEAAALLEQVAGAHPGFSEVLALTERVKAAREAQALRRREQTPAERTGAPDIAGPSNPADYKRQIEECIRGHQWAEAREMIAAAAAGGPDPQTPEPNLPRTLDASVAAHRFPQEREGPDSPPPNTRLEGDRSLAHALTPAAAKELAQREATRSRGLIEARELVTKGDLRTATKRFRALAKQFPGDSDVERESTAAEQAQQAFLLEEERHKSREHGRKKVRKLLSDHKFEAALELLQPLLREAHGDPEFQAFWRAAMEGKGRRANWLEVYETLDALERLYQKGKARGVYLRAGRLLEKVEEPRARELFQWAENVLTQDEASGLVDRLRRWSTRRFRRPSGQAE